MSVYLLPFTGTGARADPFRPDGVDQLGSLPWSMIDLRADCTTTTGRCIVSTTGVIDVSGIGNGRLLGAHIDATVNNPILTVLRAALGVTAGELPDTTPRTIIKRLLTTLGREDGTRWRPLAAFRAGEVDIHEAWLGGELLFRDLTPVVQGGAISESFNKADSTTLGPDHAWTEVLDDSEVVSNAYRPVTVASAIEVYARCNTDLGTVDHYASGVVSTLTHVSQPQVGVAVRFADAASTFYEFAVLKSGAFPNGAWSLNKVVATAYTTLIANTGFTWAANDVIKGSARGSIITVHINGGQVGQTTDSTITGGTKAGIAAYRDNASDDPRLDSWEAGDVTIASPYWIASAAQVNMSTATTAAVAIPATGQVAGRLILVHFTLKTTSGTVSAPASEGWVQIATTGTTNLVDVVYAKVWGLAGQTDNTTTGNFTATNSPTTNGWGYTVTTVGNPAHTTCPWRSVAEAYEATAAATHTANTTMTGTAVTPKGTRRTVLNFFGSSDDNAHATPSTGYLAYGGANYDQVTGTTDYAQSLSVNEDVSSDPGITMSQSLVGPDTYDDLRIVLKIPLRRSQMPTSTVIRQAVNRAGTY